jgi:hypothetical protein
MTTRRGGPLELAQVALGYKEASDVLIAHLAQYGRNDGLVYPIIFGYRQYLELTIKALTLIVNRLDGDDEGFKRTHDLDRLWRKIQPRLLEAIEQENLEPLRIVETAIMDFHGIDPLSDGFRFPSGINQFNVDLRNMRSVMDRVAKFLDSLFDWLHAGLDAME